MWSEKKSELLPSKYRCYHATFELHQLCTEMVLETYLVQMVLVGAANLTGPSTVDDEVNVPAVKQG